MQFKKLAPKGYTPSNEAIQKYFRKKHRVTTEFKLFLKPV
jgi:hypothetical protein